MITLILSNGANSDTDTGSLEKWQSDKKKFTKEFGAEAWLAITANVITVMASGEDLEYIKKQYAVDVNAKSGFASQYVYSIPMIETAEEMIWCGDFAKTIISNI
jgi:hypothetical protein